MAAYLPSVPLWERCRILPVPEPATGHRNGRVSRRCSPSPASDLAAASQGKKPKTGPKHLFPITGKTFRSLAFRGRSSAPPGRRLPVVEAPSRQAVHRPLPRRRCMAGIRAPTFHEPLLLQRVGPVGPLPHGASRPLRTHSHLSEPHDSGQKSRMPERHWGAMIFTSWRRRRLGLLEHHLTGGSVNPLDTILRWMPALPLAQHLPSPYPLSPRRPTFPHVARGPGDQRREPGHAEPDPETREPGTPGQPESAPGEPGPEEQGPGEP